MIRNRLQCNQFLPMIASRDHWCGGWIIVIAMTFGQSAFASVVDEGQAKSEAPVIPILPNERGGQNLVGRPWPELELVHVPNDDAASDESGAQSDAATITLYRWWTTGCPYCEKSLPVIDEWRRKYAAEGLRTVAVYHPKPPRDVSESFVRRAAAELNYHGDLAIDPDWSRLRTAAHGWGSSGSRRATSVSFLVDHKGIIRFVHPGPDFFPSDEAQHHRQNNDHALLEEAIELLLKSLPEPAADDTDVDANSSP